MTSMFKRKRPLRTYVDSTERYLELYTHGVLSPFPFAGSENLATFYRSRRISPETLGFSAYTIASVLTVLSSLPARPSSPFSSIELRGESRRGESAARRSRALLADPSRSAAGFPSNNATGQMV